MDSAGHTRHPVHLQFPLTSGAHLGVKAGLAMNSYRTVLSNVIWIDYKDIKKILRHLLGITKLDKEKNQCIWEKTGTENIVTEIKQYQERWLQHIQSMDTKRIPKQALQYKPKGRRNIGRPRKRWRDQFHFENQGTGNTPNPSRT
jgi:hypothetical protein